jgi:hypothetical protein
MRPLLPEAGGTIAAVERWGPSAIERKLVALERRRAKLVPMLAMHRCRRLGEPDFASSLRSVDEMILLVKRIALALTPPAKSGLRLARNPPRALEGRQEIDHSPVGPPFVLNHWAERGPAEALPFRGRCKEKPIQANG